MGNIKIINDVKWVMPAEITEITETIINQDEN